jgi:hypothetical protein
VAKWVKIEYASSRNITVQGVEYIEVGDDATRADVDAVRREAVNEFMEETSAELVDEPGEDSY